MRAGETGGPGAARRTRLTPEREGELYEAVLDLLREAGYDSLTMEAVAARSRSSKATLYRQWRTKPQLVAAALRHAKPFTLDDLDTGTLAGDLYEMARRAGEGKKDLALVRAVAPAVRHDPDLADAMRKALVEPELEVMRAILGRAAARGEIPADSPAREFLPHMWAGAMFARPLVEQREPDTEYLRRYLDAVVLPALTRE